MPISILNTRRKAPNADAVKTVEVRWDDETAAVTYRIGALSPALIGKLGKDATLDTVVEFLTLVLQSWELVDEDGQTPPIEQAFLESLPLDFLNAVALAVIEDTQPPKQSADSSFAA